MSIKITLEEYTKKFGHPPDFSTAKQSSSVKEPTLGQRLDTTGTEMREKVSGNISGTGEYANKSLINRGVGATAAVFSGVAKGALDYAPKPIRQAATYVGEKVGQGFNATAEKIGDTKLFKEAAQGDTKTLEDTLGIVSGVGEIAGTIAAAEGGVKTLNKGVNLTKKVATATSNAANTIKNVIPSSKAVGDIANPERIMQRVARIPKGAQASFEKTAGESIGNYLNKRNIYGDKEQIATQLYDRFSKSKDTADAALATLKGTFKTTPLKTALEELIQREKRVSSPGALSPDFKRTRELVNKFKKEGLDMSEINEVKRLFERNVRLDFVKQNLPEGVARANNIDNALREWQFEQAKKLGLKNLPDINKETRLSKTLLDAIGKESAGSAGNNAITLTDYILLAGGDPTAIAGFIGKKIFSSEKLQSGIAKKLYKGEKIPQVQAQFGKPRPDLTDFNKKYK